MRPPKAHAAGAAERLAGEGPLPNFPSMAVPAAIFKAWERGRGAGRKGAGRNGTEIEGTEGRKSTERKGIGIQFLPGPFIPDPLIVSREFLI